MNDTTKNITGKTYGLFYILIVFEILFMISPAALYYYSVYGPVLNFFQGIPGGSWLTSFFLPHFSRSSIWFFNKLMDTGFIFFFSGLIIFIVSAGQIYFNKLTGRGALTRGLYRVIRHPQYTAFMIMGFGTMLIWPRFFILIMYVIMFFLYFLLALKEEKDCIKKFGDSYLNYLRHTSMFIPGDSVLKKYLDINRFSHSVRIILVLAAFVTTLCLSLFAAFSLRDYSVNKISLVLTGNSATISPSIMNSRKIAELLTIAESDSLVQQTFRSFNITGNDHLLNYLVPAEWILPDIPIDDMNTSIHGHNQPEVFDRNKFKLLFTKAVIPGGKIQTPKDILFKTTKRLPLITVYIDYKEKKVTKIKTPPKTVLWGDIPTPIF